MLSPASTKWRSAYYACGICRHDADFISPKGLIPICSDCKARYIGIFGYEAFEMNMQETKRKEKKRKEKKRKTGAHIIERRTSEKR
jgi:hypothetical protein